LLGGEAGGFSAVVSSAGLVVTDDGGGGGANKEFNPAVGGGEGLGLGAGGAGGPPPKRLDSELVTVGFFLLLLGRNKVGSSIVPGLT